MDYALLPITHGVKAVTDEHCRTQKWSLMG